MQEISALTGLTNFYKSANLRDFGSFLFFCNRSLNFAMSQARRNPVANFDASHILQ